MHQSVLSSIYTLLYASTELMNTKDVGARKRALPQQLAGHSIMVAKPVRRGQASGPQ